MRHCCRVFICVLACLLACSARATQITIQDPGPFTINPITTTPFPVGFTGNCDSLLPAGNPAAGFMGCFGFVNRTSSDWIGLTLELTSGAPTNGAFSCLAGVFATSDCSSVTTLTFTNGVIPVQSNTGLLQYFVIAEDDIPPGGLTFEAYPIFASTPEPSAMLLLATGAVCATGLMYSRRRSLSA